jgi:hypothetical protein
VFCWAFADFGDKFEVSDTTGEEAKEVLVGDISKVKVTLSTRNPNPVPNFIPNFNFQFSRNPNSLSLINTCP